MFAEAVVAGVGKVVEVLDPRLGAPSLLREGEVEAHGVGRRLVGQRPDLLVEATGLLVADRRVERRHHAEEPGLAG
jgi:hypothetical protein